MKNSPPEENNDVHSSKQPNSKSTKMKTKQTNKKKAHTEKQKQKQKSHSRGSVHLAAFTVLSNHPSSSKYTFFHLIFKLKK